MKELFLQIHLIIVEKFSKILKTDGVTNLEMLMTINHTVSQCNAVITDIMTVQFL